MNMDNLMRLENLKDSVIELITILLVCFLLMWGIGFFIYPAFSWLFLVAMFATFEACRLGYLEIDFLGLATLPYQIITLGTYTFSFAVLHLLKFSGYIDLEIQWLTLGVVAIFSVFISFMICWFFNKPK